MGDSNKNIKRELNLAVKNALHAQEYINLALNSLGYKLVRGITETVCFY